MIVFVCFAKREYNLYFYAKHDLAFAYLCEMWLLTFPANVKFFFKFFVMRDKANYLCVKLFSEEV